MHKISATNLIWVDLEMTGLDPDTDHILEIAVVVTDKHLNVLAEGPVVAIHQPPSVLAKMDEWNVSHHTKSGLVERVAESKLHDCDAEKALLEFLGDYVPPQKSPMCGNSICQDRRFMHRFMPELERYFHYRNLDVSTLKILAKLWFPGTLKSNKKKTKHQALSDIYDSIDELKFYREHLLVHL